MAAVLCLTASQGRAAELHVEGGRYTARDTPLSARIVPLPAGFLHTDGPRIVGPDGAPARLLAVNWYGLASPALSPAGLADHNDRELLATIRRLGFNTVRLPFCDALFDASQRPRAIDTRLNPELSGPDGAPLQGLALLDRLVAHASDAGLKIILDHHSSAPADGPNANGLWYDPAYRYESDGQPQDAANWTRTWLMLARHFAGNPTVIGADLANEPHGIAHWGGGGGADWPLAATRAGNAILAIAPNWLIFVEGTDREGTLLGNWGGNLAGAAREPIQLAMPHRLVYAPHAYPPDAAGAPSSRLDVAAQRARWQSLWGFLTASQPVFLGEFNSARYTAADRLWLMALLGTIGDGSWGWWSLAPDAAQPDGLLLADWRSPNPIAADALIAAQGAEPGALERRIAFEVRLDGPQTMPVAVDVATEDGTARAGRDYIPLRQRLVFHPGETSQIVSVTLTTDPARERAASFSLVLANPTGAGLAAPRAAGRIEPPAPWREAPGGATATLVPILRDGGLLLARIDIANGGTTPIADWRLAMTNAGRVQGFAGAAPVFHLGADWMLAPSPHRPLLPGDRASLLVILHNEPDTVPGLHLLTPGPTSGGDP